MQAANIQESLRNLQIEKVRRLQKEVWRKKPLVWLKDRFKEDPADYKWTLRPGYEGHKWDGDIDPLSSAWEALAQNHWVGIEAATGTSKTFLLSRVIFWFLDVYENSLVVTTAPKQDQLKLHLWAEVNNAFHKFKRIRPKAELLSLRLKVDGLRIDAVEDEESFADSWHAVGFVSGTGTEEQSATRAQGFHRENMLLISEETAGMHHAVMTAFKNTCTGTRNMILAVGNPDSELDTLHQFCMLQHVKKFRISAYDYPNVVQKEEIIKGAVTIGSIERRVIEYGRQSQLFLSRVRGISPEQSIDSLIKVSWIKNCIRKADLAVHGENAVGVDVSNSEAGDKAALAWGKNNRLIHVHEFQCSNATHLAYNLMYDEFELEARGYTNYHTWRLDQLNIGANQVGVDSVGVGVATVNAFVDMSMIVLQLEMYSLW